jgi:tetratricopeptide (TPR) repeat protein
MKRAIIFYAISLGALLTASGCSSDFLDKEPPLNLIEEEVFGDPERMEGAINGLYLALKDGYFAGGKLYVALDCIGEELLNVSGNGYELQETSEMRVGMTTQENSQTWEYGYRAINKANIAIVKLEEFKDVAGSNYARYMAEAKFIRAITYYYLHAMYTMPYMLEPNALSVVLRLTPETQIAGNDLARSTSQEILDQILSDLAASEALPIAVNTYDAVTRATQAAAEMLKMRIYMTMNDWDKAIAAGEKITGYSLVPDLSTFFQAPYISEEAIFSLPMAATNRPGNQYAVPSYYYDGTSVVLDTASNIISIPGYGLKEDIRISKLVSGNLLGKFTDGSTYLNWVPLFRYGETLLNLSESYYNKGDEAKAKELLLTVRRRSLPAASDPIDFESLTGEALKTAICYERRAEFIGEGIRALDIRRRGETIVKQKGTIRQIETTPEQGTNAYIWPIPRSEQSQNKLIDN